MRGRRAEQTKTTKGEKLTRRRRGSASLCPLTCPRPQAPPPRLLLNPHPCESSSYSAAQISLPALVLASVCFPSVPWRFRRLNKYKWRVGRLARRLVLKKEMAVLGCGSRGGDGRTACSFPPPSACTPCCGGEGKVRSAPQQRGRKPRPGPARPPVKLSVHRLVTRLHPRPPWPWGPLSSTARTTACSLFADVTALDLTTCGTITLLRGGVQRRGVAWRGIAYPYGRLTPAKNGRRIRGYGAFPIQPANPCFREHRQY